jgi:uncharacterized cupredoxin-like copper-binding protein
MKAKQHVSIPIDESKEFTKLGIFGSRSLWDSRAEKILYDEIIKYNVTEIITAGEPQGVCEHARKIAQKYSIPLKLYFLDFKHLAGAYEHRSINVFKACERMVFVHDGKNKGTKNEIVIAQKMNVPMVIHVIEAKKKKDKETDEWNSKTIEW